MALAVALPYMLRHVDTIVLNSRDTFLWLRMASTPLRIHSHGSRSPKSRQEMDALFDAQKASKHALVARSTPSPRSGEVAERNRTRTIAKRTRIPCFFSRRRRFLRRRIKHACRIETRASAVKTKMFVQRLDVYATTKRLVHVEELPLPANTLHAVLGVSGSGKTTLCAALAGHIAADERTSSVWIGGRPATRRQRIACVNFIPSRAPTFGNLSVEETIRFARAMYERAEMTADELIETFGLEGCRGTRLELVSAGERKRVQIARNIVNSAPIVVIDEPTSELDETSAATVLALLRRMRRDFTIVCTTHDAHHLHHYDQCTILKDGECCLHATTDRVQRLLSEHSPSPPLAELRDDHRDVEMRELDGLVAPLVKPASACAMVYHSAHHQMRVYARTHMSYAVLGSVVTLMGVIKGIFEGVDPDYEEYIEIPKRIMQALLFLMVIPFMSSSMLHPPRHAMFPGLRSDSINNGRSVCYFLLGDYVTTSAYLVWLVAIVHAVSCALFEYHPTPRTFLATCASALTVNNLASLQPYLWADFAVCQGTTHVLWATVMLLSGFPLPPRAFGGVQRACVCYMPTYRIFAMIYERDLRKFDDDVEIYRPFACHVSDGAFFGALWLSTFLLWLAAAYVRGGGLLLRPDAV